MDGIFLPAGRHTATLEEIRERFVVGAPHSQWRESIYHAFVSWALQVWAMLPAARLWVDGGFMTHKDEPPRDVDVVLLARRAELQALDEAQQEALVNLLTDASSGARVQPMGGLVDGFLAERGDVDSAANWDRWWSNVRDDDGEALEGATKGYVVVKP